MSDRRRIAYVSGTRADFGLMRSTVLALAAAPDLDLEILVTGMHLLPEYGETVREIEAEGVPIRARVRVEGGEPSGALMSRNLGEMLIGFTESLAESPPDLLLVLGDRGEMLAGALAALHLNIPVVHIHGGERSGTVDEPVLHAISKLSHVHLVATEESRARLIRMGEDEESVYVVGAPGLDGLAGLATKTRSKLAQEYGLDVDRPIALLVYHPVLEDSGKAGAEARMILGVLRQAGVQVIALMPNSDAGSGAIQREWHASAAAGDLLLFHHLPREAFVSLLAEADLLVGNSSSGIIEAATFGTPVINIGSRQNLRQRNANVLDVPVDPTAIFGAIAKALANGRFPAANVYGDGTAGARIADILRSLDPASLKRAKVNAY
jgi:GDP/UDP-N,N'-diacetylbacillosamine 2-epimerase (hydrolysing)